MDIVEFLRARLDEDEREAKVCLDRWATEGHGTRRRWDRQLREVEAKRRVLYTCDTATRMWLHARTEEYADGVADPGDTILRALAAVYADHPDYDPAWTVG